MTEGTDIIAATERVSAPNYAPLPVVVSRAEGVWAFDVDGRKYLDCISAYSSLNQGHRHPRIVAALLEQAGRVTLTSRAVHNDRMGPFLENLCTLAGFEMALPMNTGAEAVETAIKLARKWSYRVKGVPQDRAEIIVCRNNFHGRTTTIVGFSSEPQYREDFGPYTHGFKLIDFGDLEQLRAAITPRTRRHSSSSRFRPKPASSSRPTATCSRARPMPRAQRAVRARRDSDRARPHGQAVRLSARARRAPDVLVLGKALGGGLYPVSAVLAARTSHDVLRPGDHGSTFGGNPLASAVGSAALEVVVGERLAERAAQLGEHLLDRLRTIRSSRIVELRGKGLLVGIEIAADAGTARAYCERLLEHGVLCKDTHAQVIRLAPPLIVERDELDWLVAQLRAVLE